MPVLKMGVASFANPWCTPIVISDYVLFRDDFITAGTVTTIAGTTYTWNVGPTGITLISDGTSAQLTDTTTGTIIAYATVPLAIRDCVVEAKLGGAPTLSQARTRLETRRIDNNNRLVISNVTASPNNYTFSKVVGSSTTVLSTRTDLIPTVGDVLKISDHGNHVIATVNGVALYEGDITDLAGSTNTVGVGAQFSAATTATKWDYVTAYVPGAWITP